MGSMKTKEQGRTMRTVPGRTGTALPTVRHKAGNVLLHAGGPGGRVEAPGPGKCRPGPAGGRHETRSWPAHTQACQATGSRTGLGPEPQKAAQNETRAFSENTQGRTDTLVKGRGERVLQPWPLPRQRCEPQHEKEPSAGRPATAEKPSIRTPGRDGERHWLWDSLPTTHTQATRKDALGEPRVRDSP